MTKKRSSEILADKNHRKFFSEKVNLAKFSPESEKFSKIGGKSETWGNAPLPRGDGRPCPHHFPQILQQTHIPHHTAAL